MGIGRHDRIAIVLPNGQTATTLSPLAELLRKLATAAKFGVLKDLPRINPVSLAYKTVSCDAEIVRSE